MYLQQLASSGVVPRGNAMVRNMRMADSRSARDGKASTCRGRVLVPSECELGSHQTNN